MLSCIIGKKIKRENDLYIKKFTCFMIFVMLIGTLSSCGFPDNIGKYAKPMQYALSEQAKCSSITDYGYDEDGRLMTVTQFCYVGYIEAENDTGTKVHYRYDNESIWYQKNHTLYFYDMQDRLVKTEQYVSDIMNGSSDEPYHMVEYIYDEEGGYSETGSTLGVFDYEKNYDSEGKLLSNIVTYNSDSRYYYYNENGKLVKIKDGYDVTVASLIYDDTGSVSLQSYRSGSYYAMWLDLYSGTNRTSSYWYLALHNLAEEYSFEEIESIGVPSYQTHYNGDKLIDAITTNEWVRTLEANKNYEVRRYEFFDYDESGQVIWNYSMGTSDTVLCATHYIYDGDKLIHEVCYLIEGEWQHTLYDDSVIEICRDDSDRPVDITRYDSSGNVMYRYQFEDDYWGAKELVFTLNADGDVMTDWKHAEKKLAELSVQEDNAGSEDVENDDNTTHVDWEVYYVRKGDCLWSIAERLLGNGKRWIEIYEINRNVIGNNPELIYEGTELKVAYDACTSEK